MKNLTASALLAFQRPTAMTVAQDAMPLALLVAEKHLKVEIDSYRRYPKHHDRQILRLAFWSWFAKQPDTLRTAQAERQLEILQEHLEIKGEKNSNLACALFDLQVEMEIALINVEIDRDLGHFETSDIHRAQKILAEAEGILEHHFKDQEAPDWLQSLFPPQRASLPAPT